MSEKTPNYTEENENVLRALYAEHGTEGIDTVVGLFNQTFPDNQKVKRSITSKLMSMRRQDEEGNDVLDEEGRAIMLYVPMEKVSKAKKDEGPTKKELIRDLEAILAENIVDVPYGFDTAKYFGAAQKPGIEWLVKVLSEIRNKAA